MELGKFTHWVCPTCTHLAFTIDIPETGEPNCAVVLECIAIHKSRCSAEHGYVIPPKGER